MESEDESHATIADQVPGVILGTAVGDALGLPREGLSHVRTGRLFGPGRWGISSFSGAAWSATTPSTAVPPY
jgi:hypothetical protein